MTTVSEDGVQAHAGSLIAGRYRLETELGSGAMGTVWSATDEFLHRPVAVKQMLFPADLPEEEAAELRERALREARATALLTHPNVVTLYDVVREGEQPFVVMELVPSQSLAAIVNRHGPLTDEQLAVVADGVAAALEAAHRSGIIHRDVKPGNVLIGAANRVKLSDFGISRNLAEPTMTVVGIMLGTPAYVAPEIVVGDVVSTSADLWSLGATLFAAAEGHPPYDSGGDPLATITAVARDPVPKSHRAGPLGEIIAGLLVKDPTRRMPLAEVRGRVRYLLSPGSWPFETLLDPHLPTVRIHRPTTPVPQSRPSTLPAPMPRPGPALPARPGTLANSGALASHPGPLPFTPSVPVPVVRRRSILPSIALGTVAAVLFLVAAGTGFVASRTIAGRSLMPAVSSPAELGQPIVLVRYAGTTPQVGDTKPGAFTVFIPQGWTVFDSELDELSTSETVDFVSPDGNSEVSVQRYGGFYSSGHTTQEYLKNLPTLVPGAHLTQNVARNSTDRFVSYTITDSGLPGSSGPPLEHDTLAELMPRGSDLWVLSVTVAPEQAAWGTTLFDSILARFVPTAG